MKTRFLTSSGIHWALPGMGHGKAILLLPSLWGATAGAREIGERWAGKGFTVAIPDLHGGDLPANLGEAGRLRARGRRTPVSKLLLGAIEGLRMKSGAETIGVAGFSQGARRAVWLSQQGDLPITATVLFYGARGGDFSASHSDFQCHFAAEPDPSVSAASRRRMLQRLSDAGRPVQVFEYPRCGHGFAEKGIQDSYSPRSARLALERAARFLGGMAPIVGERVWTELSHA